MTAPTLDTRPFDGVTIPTAGTFALDPAHTEVAAIARHLVVSKVRGTFGGTTGTIVIADDPLQSSVTASIPAATINTNSTDRDNHLRSADFLDVENHPTLDFRSTSIVSHKGAEFVVRGDLTIRGVTREVELDARVTGAGTDPWGNERLGLELEGEIDRHDFGVSWNTPIPTGGLLLGDTVTLSAGFSAVKEA